MEPVRPDDVDAAGAVREDRAIVLRHAGSWVAHLSEGPLQGQGLILVEETMPFGVKEGQELTVRYTPARRLCEVVSR